MAPKRRMDGQSVYDLLNSTKDDEEQPTPSGQEDATTPAEPAENESQAIPLGNEAPPASNSFAAPQSPAYGSDNSDGGGFIDRNHAKKREQKVSNFTSIPAPE